MNDVLKSIGRGLAGLLSFGGRSGRARFWHHAGFVILATQLAGMAAILPVFARIQRYLIEHPEQTRVSSGPGHYSVEIIGAPAMGPLMAGTAKIGGFVSLVAVALLAAAVARRLHDCDRRGYWGLLPLPFLAAATLLMPRAFGAFMGGGGPPDLNLFFALIFNNLLYLGSLGLLIVLLAGKGTPGPNRFGPPPA